MRSVHVVGFVLLTGLLCGPIVGQAPSPEPEGTYGTPKAVFAAAFGAMKKKDYKTFLKCLTPDSRDRMTAQLVTAGAIFRLMANPGDAKSKDLVAEFDKALARHGVTKEAVAKYEAVKDPKESEKATKALAALVKDRPAFTGDVMKLLEKLSAGKGSPETSELKDLKITGDKAKGNAVSKVNGMEVSQPIDFVKIGGSWHMVVPDTRARTDEDRQPQPIDKK